MEAWEKVKNFFMPEIPIELDTEYDMESENKLEEKEVRAKSSAKTSTYASEEVQQAKVVNGTESVVRPAPRVVRPEPVVNTPVVKMSEHKRDELEINIYSPAQFEDVRAIADNIRAKKAAIVNYERVDAPMQRRICDFMNGACYVLDGEARRISASMVLYVPTGVNVGDIPTANTQAFGR